MSDHTDSNIAWASVKLSPDNTGLPMVIWLAQRNGHQFIKVNREHGLANDWPAAISVAMLPNPHELGPGSLPADDLALVTAWIEANRNTITDFWHHGLAVDELLARLRKLP